MTTQYNPIAVTRQPVDSGKLSTYAKGVVSAVQGNQHFPGSNLGALNAAIVVLDAAVTLAGTKAPGSVQARASAHRKVNQALGHVRDYVQSVVETATTVVDAIAIIHSAAMYVKRVTKPAKPVFAATPGAVPGEAVLAARAVPRARSYYWQFSLDQKTWTSVPETAQTTTTITGLVSAQTYYFRFRALTRTGLGDYSQIVSLLVH